MMPCIGDNKRLSPCVEDIETLNIYIEWNTECLSYSNPFTQPKDLFIDGEVFFALVDQTI